MQNPALLQLKQDYFLSTKSIIAHFNFVAPPINYSAMSEVLFHFDQISRIP